MMTRKKFGAWCGILGALALAVAIPAAFSQQVVVPQVQSVGTTDLFLDVVRGTPTAQGFFASASQISGPVGYVYGGAGTGTITYTMLGANGGTSSNQTNYFLNAPSATTSVNITMQANPGDGQRFCYMNLSATTSLTFTANTGQTVANTPTAGVALVPICATWVAAQATWYRSP